MTIKEILDRLRDKLIYKNFHVKQTQYEYEPNICWASYEDIRIVLRYPAKNIVSCVEVQIKDRYHNFWGEEMDIHFAELLLRQIDVHLAADIRKKSVSGRLNDLFGVTR